MPLRSLTDVELLEQIQQLSKAAREQLLAGDPVAARITRTRLLQVNDELARRHTPSPPVRSSQPSSRVAADGSQ